MSADLIGRLVLGRYRIVRQLAEGGMGVVYLARAEGAAGFVKPVVIKLILAKLSQNPQFLGMFVREAQILAQLRHPSIVDVIEFAEDDGAYVMVLEYVAGYHLGQWDSYLKRRQRAVPSDLAILIITSVLDALHHVHTQCLPDGTPLNITHRDISPSNILLGTDGYARLLDFGVARMEADTLFRTEGSGFRGKVVYAAPELFDDGDATPLSDVYSCAVVLHEVLLGRNTFMGRSQAETLARVINHVPESVHGVRDDAPDDIDAILARALAKSKDARFASAAEFAQVLRGTQRVPEPELRERLATLLRADFGGDMAHLLGLESLAMRERAWRRFSMAPPPRSPIAGPSPVQLLWSEEGDDPSIHEQPTRALDAPLSAADPEPVAPPAPAPAPVPVPVPAPAPAPAQPLRRSSSGPALAAFAIAVVAIAAVAWRWAVASERAPEQIVLVQSDIRAEAPAPAPEPVPEPIALSAPAPVIAPAPEPERPASDPRPAAARAAKAAPQALTVRSGGPDLSALTRAFRQKQKQVEACFADHATDAPGTAAVAIRFDVDGQGRAEQAAVVPETLAATALGSCLHAVALATRFPASGDALSFRIPVTARKLPADR